MRDNYPEYQRSVFDEITPQGDSVERALGARAELAGQIANKASSFVHGEIDAKAQAQAAQDAEKQGINWHPKSNLTEAGRAYNQMGQNIAQNYLAAQVQTGLNSVYNSAIKSPVNLNPKTGTLATFKMQAEKYYQGLRQNADTSMVPALTKMYANSLTNYSSRLANHVSQYSIEQSDANQQQLHTNLSNQASSNIYTAYQIQDPEQRQNAIENAYQLYQQSNSALDNNQSLASNPAREAILRQRSKLGFLESMTMGRLAGLQHQYQLPTLNDAQRSQIAQQIESFPENFANDKSIKSIYDGMDFDQTLTPSMKLSLQSRLRAMANSTKASIGISKSMIRQSAANGIAGISHGQDATPDQLEAIQSTGQIDRYNAAKLGYSVLKSAYNGSAEDFNNLLQSANNGKLYQQCRDQGIQAYQCDKVVTQVSHGLRMYQKQLLHDPKAATQNDPNYNQFVNSKSSSLITSNSNENTQQLQNEYNQSLNDPIYLMTKTLPDNVKLAFQQTADQSAKIQMHKGVSAAHVQGFTSQSAKLAVAHLANQSGGDRVQSLSILAENTGASWPTYQQSLIKAGLPYSDIIATSLAHNPDTSKLSDELLASSDFMGQDRNAWKESGTTYAAAASSVRKNNSMVQLASSFMKTPGKDSEHAYRAIMDSAINLAIYRARKTSGDPDYYTAVTEVVGGLYSSTDGGLRIPKTFTTGNAGNQVTQTIDPSTIKGLQKYYLDNADKYIAMPKGDTHIRNKYLQEVRSGQWVNASGDRGLMLVDKFGVPVKFKNGGFYGFGWARSLPHNLPVDYNEQSKRWYNLEGFL